MKRKMEWNGECTLLQLTRVTIDHCKVAVLANCFVTTVV